MTNRLENFVRDHRDQFDGEEPDSKIWEAIRKDMGLGEDPNKKKPASVVRLLRARYAVAAAVVLLIAGSVWFFSTRQDKTPNNPAVASGTRPTPQTTQPTSPATQTPVRTPDSTQSLAGSNPDVKTAPNDNTDINAEQNEEMYHY